MGSPFIGGPGSPSGGGGSHLEKLSLPGLLLMISMGIGMAFQLISLLLNLLGAGLGVAGGTDVAGLMSGFVGIIFNIVAMCVGGVIIFGLMKYRKGESFVFSLVSVILAMIPCISPCCWFGLPLGIWALVVMNSDDVKSQFNG